MSARDVIAAEFGRMHQSVCYPTASDGEKEWAGDSILSALTAAGWTLAPPGSRVVPEGGVDAPTVERCIAEIDCGCERDHCPSPGFCVKDDVDALRSLIEEPTNDAR